jgi:hypothetical protein
MGHNVMLGHPHDVFGVFSYYQLVMLFLDMIYLTVAFAKSFDMPPVTVLRMTCHPRTPSKIHQLL